ncbi:MAG: hypothetical protein Q6363_005425 [Candidatus Njordarchaeota archaeon]
MILSPFLLLGMSVVVSSEIASSIIFTKDVRPDTVFGIIREVVLIIFAPSIILLLLNGLTTLNVVVSIKIGLTMIIVLLSLLAISDKRYDYLIIILPISSILGTLFGLYGLLISIVFWIVLRFKHLRFGFIEPAQNIWRKIRGDKIIFINMILDVFLAISILSGYL